MNLTAYLPEGSIITQAHAADWRAAVRLAGDALVAQGLVTDAYPEQMVQVVEELGPYIVIAPGFALAHARPSAAVRKSGISWVGLAQPVAFGNKANDPVKLVIGLAAVDHDSHLGIMSALAEFLDDAEALNAATNATNPDQVRKLLSVVE